MENHEGTFRGTNEINLYYKSSLPQSKADGVVIIIHGLGVHSGIFNNIFNYLVSHNYAVYGYDLRGHGRSPGKRGYINSWAEFREDLQAFVNFVQSEQPLCPVFILGHSLGGVIVLDYLLYYQEKITGAITIAPAIGKVGVSPLKFWVARILSGIWPSFTLDTGLDISGSTRDPQVLAAYAQDPLRHTRGSARLATEFFRTVSNIYNNIPKIQIPFLMLQGGADKVTFAESTRNFFEKINYSDKELREYPGVYHDIFNDFGYQDILADLVDWLNQHK